MLKFYFSLLTIVFTQWVSGQENNHNLPPARSTNSLMIRTNIPSWFIAIPSIGLEYKISERSSVLLDGDFSNWNFKRKGNHHYWKSWRISPQVRQYINFDKSTYLGLQYNMGEYNISSQQGKFYGGGISIGKQYVAAKKLFIDIGVTMGYLRFDNQENFQQVNGVFYRSKDKGSRNYWGPTDLSIRLSRKIN